MLGSGLCGSVRETKEMEDVGQWLVQAWLAWQHWNCFDRKGLLQL